jgi:hypothetical protein
VSCLHIPAPDPARSTAFYRAAFAWSIRDDKDSPAFADGTAGSEDPATDDVIRGVQNGTICSRRLMNADAVMAAPESAAEPQRSVPKSGRSL